MSAGAHLPDCARMAPAQVRHDSPFASIELAANGEVGAWVEQLARALQQAGVALAFYRRLGYVDDRVTVLGRRLHQDAL